MNVPSTIDDETRDRFEWIIADDFNLTMETGSDGTSVDDIDTCVEFLIKRLIYYHSPNYHGMSSVTDKETAVTASTGSCNSNY